MQIPSMSSSSAAAEQIPRPPTYRFRPKKRELIEFYLLPLSRGQDPFPGVIFEDDAAGCTLPWDLFERHGVGGEDEAYFIVRASEAKKPGARQDRACDGGVGSWKMQTSVDKFLRVRGERIKIHVSNLNLHMGKGKNSGSVGWVMHEYSIAEPSCPSLVKICQIAFSGHGRMRMRVPDGQQVRQSSGHASGDEEPSHLVLIDGNNFRQWQCPFLGSSDFHGFPSAESASEQFTELEAQVPFLGSSDFQGFPSAASASEQFTELEAQVTTTEQQDIVVPQLIVQPSAMPVARQLSLGELEFWNSIGVDLRSSFDQEQLNDFCRSIQINCAAPDLGNIDWWLLNDL